MYKMFVGIVPVCFILAGKAETRISTEKASAIGAVRMFYLPHTCNRFISSWAWQAVVSLPLAICWPGVYNVLFMTGMIFTPMPIGPKWQRAFP